MDRSEKKTEMKKTRPIKITWYDWLINFIPKPIRKMQVVLKINCKSFEDKVFLRQTHLKKLCMEEERS